jgi:hypothetical protein
VGIGGGGNRIKQCMVARFFQSMLESEKNNSYFVFHREKEFFISEQVATVI